MNGKHMRDAVSSDNRIRSLRNVFSRSRTLIMALSAVIVFVTSYMLIMPALTLDQEEASRQGGIDIPVSEQMMGNSKDAAI